MGSNSFEKYEIVEVMRSDIHFADYNPRFIDKESVKRLKDNIKNVGLVEPIVWNKTTGRIVSEHQRVKILDSLHKGNDYSLKVAAVEFDEKTEKEQNIFMNNPAAQGDFDFAKLGDMLQSGIDAMSAGFDPAQVHKLFGNQMDQESPEEIKAMADHIRKFDEQMNKAKEKSMEELDSNFYLVTVFRSYEDRLEFTEKYGLPNDMYVSGDKIRELIEPEKEE